MSPSTVTPLRGPPRRPQIRARNPGGLLRRQADNACSSLGSPRAENRFRFQGFDPYGFNSPDELVNQVKDAAELYYDPKDRQILKKLYEENGRLVDCEVQAKRTDGQEFWVSIFARYFSGTSEEPSYYDGFALDITERKRAEYNLRESECKYRNLFDLVSDSIFLIEKETGNILEVNQSACRLYGYSRDEFLALRNVDLSAEPESTRDATRKERKTIPLRFHRKKDGTKFPVEITASHFQWQSRDVHLAAIRDITWRLQAEKEKENLQRQLQQAQKMEAIGTLAGGIAHWPEGSLTTSTTSWRQLSDLSNSPG